MFRLFIEKDLSIYLDYLVINFSLYIVGLLSIIYYHVYIYTCACVCVCVCSWAAVFLLSLFD